MKISTSRNRVTLCKGNFCLTVFGEVAKALALVAVVGVAVWTVNEFAKILK